ncbi:HmuY family protein [Mangrovivirga cuniculi]|uniref:HmuY protein n=1 Tax=Mangrovivirga cuniculi TaxID=2715131 RepID=A0A4D7JQX1_9BACT|nr:HmuY family protein [Mangrovivirga cuniculi]QCK17133.1 hypothetical protein DCC35_18335 [Mangrovivirga cuniculi]
MINFRLFSFAVVVQLLIFSCTDDQAPETEAVQSETIANLHAPQTSDYTTNPPTISGDFVKFDFSSGAVTTHQTDWDIAFRGTTILVNGGSSTGLSSEPERIGNAAAYIMEGTFSEVNNIDELKFSQDGENGLAIPTGSGNGWYNYNPANNIVSAIPGRVLVFRTADNNYAKVEILSYYKDSDTSSDSQHYTFNYTYQPDSEKESF